MSVASNTRFRRRSLLAGTAAALALIGGLTACGSTAGSNSMETAGGLETVKLQTPPFAFEAVEMAQRHGIFEKHGLKVESDYGAGEASKQIPKVVSGEINLAMSSPPDAIRAVEKGIPVVITGGAQASAKEGDSTDGLLVAPDSPIKDFKDLEGKTVGIAGLGNLSQVINNIGLQENGADPSSVKYVSLPNESLPEAATKGQVDAILPVSVIHAKAVTDGFKQIGNGSMDFFPGAPQIVWIASKQYAEQNAGTLKKFNEAMAEANKYAMAQEDEIRSIDKELTKLPADFIQTRAIEPMSIAVDRDIMGKFTGYMQEFGFISKEVPLENFVWSDAPQP